jgi:hypothetical protein
LKGKSCYEFYKYHNYYGCQLLGCIISGEFQQWARRTGEWGSKEAASKPEAAAKEIKVVINSCLLNAFGILDTTIEIRQHMAEDASKFTHSILLHQPALFAGCRRE